VSNVSLHQVIPYSNSYRQVAYDRIIEGAQKAIARQASGRASSPAPLKGKGKLHNPPAEGGSANSNAMDVSLDDQFRAAALSKYGSIEKAWNAFDSLSEPKGQITRTDWKSCLKMIALDIPNKAKGQLRKSLDKSNSKIIGLQDFEAFMTNSNGKSAKAALVEIEQKERIANVPFDSPALPDNYRARADVENQLVDLLVGTVLCKGSVICAFGMGGSGKTCITAAVINQVVVRAKFPDGIAWVGLNQKPLLQNLQKRLYYQIMTENMPKDQQGSIEDQHQVLQNAFRNKKVLIVLDGEFTQYIQ
jgi:hypothetical protein